MRLTTKLLSATTLAAALGAIPYSPSINEQGELSVTLDGVCADGSCKPRPTWDCIHGTIHIVNKCDPLVCDE